MTRLTPIWIAVAMVAPSIASAQAIPNLPMGVPTMPGTTQGGTTGAQTPQLPTGSGSADDLDGDTTVFRPTTIAGQDRSALPLTQEELLRAQVQQQQAMGQTILAPNDPRLRRLEVKPSEFETYVERVLGRRLPRFGADLLLPESRDFSAPATATVPPDYRLNVGDTLILSLTGSVDGSVERTIDTNGNIFLPRVGSIQLAGVRYADARATVMRAVGVQFRDFGVSVTVKRLRGLRVYVTGFAQRPGAYTVSSLSTLVNAVLQAGGPSAGGSFRSVKLYRSGREVTDFDLYALLLGGNRRGDAVLQNEDVLFIPPAGEQIAIIGSVAKEAIYEARAGESVDDVLRYAGGGNVLADPDRVLIYSTRTNPELGPREIARVRSAGELVQGGDIIQVLSKGGLIQPVARQSVLVRVEGEVTRPGNYYVQPNTPLASIMALAGGLTPRAYPFGTRLERVSVREQQREGYEDAIRQLEFSLAAAPLTADASMPADARAAQLSGAREAIALLRRNEPDGRVVLDIPAASTALPSDILMEGNDRLVVPPRPSTVGVFGAVYRPASFLIEGRALKIRDYVERAGGAQRVADTGRLFVVRANGAVLTKRDGALSAYALPGDVVFMPIRMNASNIWARIRDIATIVSQAGLTAATIAAIQ